MRQAFAHDTPNEAASIAAERCKVMRLLATVAPQTFLQNLLPLEFRASCPSAVAPFVEKESQIRGFAVVRIYDDFLTGTSESRLAISTESGLVELAFTSASPHITPRSEISVSGIQIGDVLVAEPANVSISRTAGVTPLFEDTIKVLALLVTFPDSNPTVVTKEVIIAKHFSDSSAIKTLYREMSGGKATITGDVFGWYLDTLVHASDTYPELVDLEGMVQAFNIDLSKYNHIVEFVNARSGGAISTLGKYPLTIQGKTYNLSTSSVSADQYFISVYNDWDPAKFDGWQGKIFVHELGHGMGLGHASGLINYNSSPTTQAYANWFDIMGWGGGPWAYPGSNPRQQGWGRHFNTCFKAKLGWLDRSSILQIYESGTYSIHPMEKMSGTRAARFSPYGDSSFAVYMEYRRPIGFDDILASSTSSPETGLFINLSPEIITGEPLSSESYLVDTTPANSGNYYRGMDDPVLIDTNTYRNDVLGITVGPILMATPDSIVFSVQIQPGMLAERPVPVSPTNVSFPYTWPLASTIEFRWRSVAHADSFEFNVNNLPNGGWKPNTVFGATRITTDTVVSISGYWYADSEYFWQVRGFRGGRKGSWSQRMYFGVGYPVAYAGNEESVVPGAVSLAQNYPNPFNPSTTIRYGLPSRARVVLTIYNTLGQQVSTLVQGEQDPGYHEVRFDGSTLPSGVYFYRIRAGSFVGTKKCLLMK